MLNLSLWQILIFMGIGAILAAAYLCLLWQTIRLLPRLKKKGLFLMASAVIRITLLLVLSILLSQHHAGKFLSIVVGFIVTRLILVGIFRKNIKEFSNG